MVTGGAVCSNWACTESVRGEVSDGLPYLDHNNDKKGMLYAFLYVQY